ncbi:hypothetical protein [Actinosynnema sp. NPDC020468]|uniref:hypothetical protein n=1 Tax=Actinosynnema sp. NPDC020468 TaxID=3154488 RepID=UPI0033D6FAA1
MSAAVDPRPVRSFPTGATYVEALQNTELCFRGTDLAGAAVRVDALGRPRAISGNFASVFSLTGADGRRYAIKCFTREVQAQSARYKAIGEHLGGLAHDWAVGFEYVERGVLVQGDWFPILRMEWVEAVGLTRWIDRNLGRPAVLARAARAFADLVADLAAADIGHGDLQHGNLLVAPDGTMRLVDYDGMYVPALAGMPAAELGHRNYQPPGRSATDFGPTVDRFSAWVIYLSLVALAVDPALWGQLREEDAEHLLLAESDFVEPDTSFRLSTLLGHPDVQVRALAGRFHDVLARGGSPPVLEPVEITAAAPVSGLPSWLTQRVRPVEVAPPPLPRVVFTRRATFLSVATWGLLAVLLVAAPLAFLTPVGVPAVAVGVLLAGFGWAAWSTAAYLRQPETALARRARAERGRADGGRTAAQRAVAELDRTSEKFDRRADETKAAADRRRRESQQRHDHELTALQRTVQQALVRIDNELRSLITERAAAEQDSLAQRQREHVRHKLARFTIEAAGIDGIGATLVTKLRDAGIATAADFTGVHYNNSGQYQSRIANFVLVNGYSVRVPGIGEVKAGRLDGWRAALAAEATADCPTSLTSAELHDIKSRFDARASTLREDHREVVTAGEAQREALLRRLRKEQTALGAEAKTANETQARDRADHNRRLSEARAVADRAVRSAAEAGALADSYRAVTFGNYVRFLLTF